MSRDMPGPHYFVSCDITDPTPWYDEEDEYYDGAECPLCGERFKRGEAVMEIAHREIGKDFIVVHCACVGKKYPDARDSDVIDDFLDAVGFEVRRGILE